VKQLKIGIIGSGGIARGAHLPNYQKLEDVQIAALCDASPKALETAGEQFGVPKSRRYADFEKMLSAVKLDGVSICTPNAHHWQPAVAALERGVHVLVEKPIAVNAKEGRAMVRAAKQNERILMVAFCQRFRNDIIYLRRAIEQGALGDIYYGEAVYMRRRGIPGWGVFADKKESGGGPLMDVGVHVLDMALHLMGYPKPVSAFGSTYDHLGTQADLVAGMGAYDPSKFSVEDFGVGLVKFENGATVLLKASWAANIKDDGVDVMLMGTRGGCQTGPLGIFTQQHGGLVDVTPVRLPKTEPYFDEVRAFVEAIRSGGPSPVPGEEGLIATRILDAIYKSGRTGKEQKV